MGFRFNKRLTIMPGVHLNLGLGGPSLSVGPRGASVNIGRRGVFGNVGIPGSGLSYRHRLDGGAERQSGQPEAPVDLTMELRDGRIEFVQPGGQVLVDELRTQAARLHRTEAEDMIEAHVGTMNAVATQLTGLHLDTPRPSHSAAPAAPFVHPKPVRTDHSDQDAYMTALMAWRASKANHEAQGPSHYDPAPLETALSALAWPRQTDISYECSRDGGVVVLDVDLPEIEDMPGQEYEVAARSLSVRTVPLSGKRVADMYSAHVTSIVFRLAGAVFASSPAREVRISGYTQRAGSTGRTEDEYVVAVVISREGWTAIDFGALANIDPENALLRFGLRLERTGRGSLRSVSPCAPLQ